MRKLTFLFSLLLLVNAFFWGQGNRTSIIEAKEEFRWGVFSFNQGNYLDALLSFEKSISFDPENDNSHFWLALTYFSLGYESEALIEWRNLQKRGFYPELLENWISTVEIRRSLIRPYYEGSDWEVIQELEGKAGKMNHFARPTIIRPDDLGGFYLVSFITNAVYYYNANGILVFSISGGINPLKNPFDIILTKDKFFISEYGSDQIRVFDTQSQTFTETIGARGINEGELLGPEYLAIDDKGYLYISEWGNQRISKFDEEGNFILSFGKAQRGFEGLQEPTGIVFRESSLYVADKKRNSLDVFDESGNYLRSYALALSSIEGLSLDHQKRILIMANQKLYAFDEKLEKLTLLQDLSRSFSKSLFFAYDANNQLLVPDFNRSLVVKMAPIPFLYEGLFVRVARIVVENHPKVMLEVVVEDRYGNPIIGLDSSNFIIKEGDFIVTEQEMPYSSYLSEDASISFIFDKSLSNKKYLNPMKSVIRSIINSLEAKKVDAYFFSSTELPILEKEGFMTDLQAANILDKENWVENSKLDLSIMSAGSLLSKGPFRRAIVLFSDGQIGDNSFASRNITELASYLKNNGISFYNIHFGSISVNNDLVYLANETGGAIISYASAEGSYPLLDKIYDQKNGFYLLEYDSLNDPEFGYRYIPVDVEVLFNMRSGLGISGYIAPKSSLTNATVE